MNTLPTTPPASPTAAVVQELPMVERSQACIKCSYQLQGLPVTGKCPECGSPVADSLKGFLIQHASPEYVRTVQTGASFVLLSIVLTLVFFILQFVVGIVAASGAVSGVGDSAIMIFGMAVSAATTALGLWGYWKYSQPDPQYVGYENTNSARSVLRGAVIAQAVLTVIGLVLQLASGMVTGTASPDAGLMVILVVVNVLIFAAWIVQFIAMMRYTRWLARRIPDVFVIKRTHRYIWLLPLIAIVGSPLLFIGPLIALVMYWNLLDRVRKQLKAIITTGQPAELKARLG